MDVTDLVTHQPRDGAAPCRCCSRATSNVHRVCVRCSPPDVHPDGGRRDCCGSDTPEIVWPELLRFGTPVLDDEGEPCWIEQLQHNLERVAS